MTTLIRRRDLPPLSSRLAFAAEIAGLVTICLLAGLLAARLELADLREPVHTIEVLAFATAIAAAILIGFAAWLSGNGRAARVALAMACFALAYLSVRAVRADADLVRDIAMVAVVVVLASALRRTDTLPRGTHAALGLGMVVAASCVVLVLAPSAVGGSALAYVAGIVACAAAGTVSVGLVLAGVRRDRPLLRRVGLAFATVTAGERLSVVPGSAAAERPLYAAALELAGVAALLAAAAHFALVTMTSALREQEESQSQLAAAEAAAASVRARDHEMRNALLGLSGAAKVLTLEELGGNSADARQLQAAAGAEIERLRWMLDGEPAAWVSSASRVDVGTLLRDLGAVHRAGGLDVRVEAAAGLHARMSAESLAQVITNLLVNCARHAAGAPVQLRASQVWDRILVEVIDDGPGLPLGVGRDLLACGVTGPSSTGQGLGLHICAELVRRSSGAIRLESRGTGLGCTVVVELPAAEVPAVLMERLPA